MIGKEIKIKHPYEHYKTLVRAIVLDKVRVEQRHTVLGEINDIYNVVDKYVVDIISDESHLRGVFTINPKEIREIIKG